MVGGAEEVCLVILEGKFEGISWSAILDGRRVEVCRYWMECFFVDDVRRVEENYASRGSSKGELSSGVVRTSDSYTSLHTVPSHDHLHTGQERLQQDRARYCSSRSKSSRIFIKKFSCTVTKTIPALRCFARCNYHCCNLVSSRQHSTDHNSTCPRRYK